MSQLAYNQDPAIGREGLIADNSFRDVLSRVAETDLPAGRVVTKGTDEKEAKLPAAAADITGKDVLGITVFDASREPHTATDEYEATDVIPVLRRGRIWMVAEDAVTEGDDVYVRHVAAGAEELGRVRSDADGTDAAILPGSTFRTSTSGADQLVVVEINLPA
jgi:hypothetical protein